MGGASLPAAARCHLDRAVGAAHYAYAATANGALGPAAALQVEHRLGAAATACGPCRPHAGLTPSAPHTTTVMVSVSRSPERSPEERTSNS